MMRWHARNLAVAVLLGLTGCSGGDERGLEEEPIDCALSPELCPFRGEVELAPGGDGGVVRFDGTVQSGLAGSALAFVGDLDGDGLGDMLIGAPGEDSGRGVIHVVSGPADVSRSLSAADAVLRGEAEGDNAGIALSGAGDVNGDGFQDVLVGAWHHDGNTGAAYLLYGPLEGEISLADADAIFRGVAADDNAGIAVSSAGDVNGDGLDDVMIGAPHNDDVALEAGAAYIFYGPVEGERRLSEADVVLAGFEAGSHSGSSVSGGGDVDGDGHDDVLVGAWGDDLGRGAGSVYVVHGPLEGGVHLLSEVGVRCVGEDAGDQAGYAVRMLGDVNGDGRDDVAVSAPFHSPSGRERAGAVYVLYGPLREGRELRRADAVLEGVEAGDNAGIALASPGDVNGDQRADVLVGAWGASQRGRAYLWYAPLPGRVTLDEAAASWSGESEGDGLGAAVAGGDLDGDGRAEVLLGGWGVNAEAANSGAAYRISAE